MSSDERDHPSLLCETAHFPFCFRLRPASGPFRRNEQEHGLLPLFCEFRLRGDLGFTRAELLNMPDGETVADEPIQRRADRAMDISARHPPASSSGEVLPSCIVHRPALAPLLIPDPTRLARGHEDRMLRREAEARGRRVAFDTLSRFLSAKKAAALSIGSAITRPRSTRRVLCWRHARAW